MTISLALSPLILQTTEAALRPGPGTVAPPWIVAAAARALEDSATKLSRHLVAFVATGCPHVQGLSTWVAVTGLGGSQAVTRLSELATAVGLPAQLESATLSEYSFVPFLIWERSATSLLFPKGGGPGLNDWVLEMAGDVSDIARVAAVTEMIAKQFSFRDFWAVPGGFEIEPPPQK